MIFKVDFIDGKITLLSALSHEHRFGARRAFAPPLRFKTVSRFWDYIECLEPQTTTRAILLEILPGHKKLVEAVAMHRATKALENTR